MDSLNILAYVLLFYIGLILASLLTAMVMGCVACMINERRIFCWCFYCKTKKSNQAKDIKLPEVIIIIEPNGDKKLGIKN